MIMISDISGVMDGPIVVEVLATWVTPRLANGYPGVAVEDKSMYLVGSHIYIRMVPLYFRILLYARFRRPMLISTVASREES